MYNDSLSKDFEVVENDDKPKEIRKYGKKINQKKLTSLKIIYFLLFLFLVLLITFFIYVALERYSTYKQMKNDLSKKENRDSQQKLEKIEAIKELLEIINKKLEDWLIDKIEDEMLKDCFKLHNLIKTLMDQLDQRNEDEDDLNKSIKQVTELLEGLIEYWENNGYEKCFGPDDGEKVYISLCIVTLYSHDSEEIIISQETNNHLDNPSLYFCPRVSQFCSVAGNCPLKY